jgi:hypothetical protein
VFLREYWLDEEMLSGVGGMKIGDMVRISSKTDGDIDGKLATVIEDVDENLRSGRMCYTKVIVMISGIPKVRYLCPDSLELVG